MRYLLSGVGGIGLSALAWALKTAGHDVIGTDRSYDQGLFSAKFDSIKKMGVEMAPQDGQAIANGQIDCVVASAAVEVEIPDIAAALEHNVPVIRRAELLAELLNNKAQSVAIAGTSGKSTVTTLVAFLARETGLDPTVINGAVMPDFDAAKDEKCSVFGNARAANSDVFIAEACESDGSVVLYKPAISLIHNITLDHKPIDELIPLFQQLADQTVQKIVYNCDDQYVSKLNIPKDKAIGYSLNDDIHAAFKAKNITLSAEGLQFDLIIDDSEAYEVRAPMLGRHNVQNILAALAIVSALGSDIYMCIQALQKFSGVKSRLELIGQIDGITILDDYAHNPDKIDAAMSCVANHAGRVLAYYQPHGFAPTRLMKDGYIESFTKNLRAQDKLFLQEIYYAGGTVAKDISSEDIAEGIRSAGALGSVNVFENRQKLIDAMVAEADEGDYILIMGARDDSIRFIGPDILQKLSSPSLQQAAQS